MVWCGVVTVVMYICGPYLLYVRPVVCVVYREVVCELRMDTCYDEIG